MLAYAIETLVKPIKEYVGQTWAGGRLKDARTLSPAAPVKDTPAPVRALTNAATTTRDRMTNEKK
jgi:hypothetical protein